MELKFPGGRESLALRFCDPTLLRLSPWLAARLVFGAAGALCVKAVARWLCVARATFGADARLPLEPRVPRKERDHELKRGGAKALEPWLTTPPDVIVIGSGIGGLVCAAILGRAQKRVLVLEQHDLAGGCCHTYSASGFEWDVGIHYVGEVGRPSVHKAILDQLTRGQLQWTRQHPHYDVICLPADESNGQSQQESKDPFERFAMGKDVSTNEELLCARFPAEAAAIREFFADVKKVQGQGAFFIIVKILPAWLSLLLGRCLDFFTGFFSKLDISVSEALTKHGIKDMQLRAALSYCWGDIGTVPGELPYGILCGLLGHFMLDGGYFPVGGAGYIGHSLTKTIRGNGGDVLVRCPVDMIRVQSGRAVGVVLSSGKQVNVAPGGHVVCAVSLAVLYDKLLREAVPRSPPCVQEGGWMREGVAAMSLFVGLEQSGAELGIDKIQENAWAYHCRDFDGTFAGFFGQTREEMMNRKHTLPGVFIGFPSSKDPSWTEDFAGKSSVTVISFVNWEWFAKYEGERVHHRSAEYKQLKDFIAEQMWEFTLQVYPQLKGAKIGHFEAGSPLSNTTFIGSSKGAIYGADHTCKRFSLPRIIEQRPNSPGIPGLTVAGQENLCCGFAGGLFGGVLAAGDVLGSNIGVWLGIVLFAGFRYLPDFTL